MRKILFFLVIIAAMPAWAYKDAIIVRNFLDTPVKDEPFVLPLIGFPAKDMNRLV